MGAGQCLVWETVSCLVMAEPLGSLGDLRPMKSASGLMGGVQQGCQGTWAPQLGGGEPSTRKRQNQLCVLFALVFSAPNKVCGT